MTHLDTSFLFKLYVIEPDSPLAVSKLRSLEGTGSVSDLSDVEMATSFHCKLHPRHAKQAHQHYLTDKSRGAFLRIDLSVEVYRLARRLAEQYAWKFKLRSLDALQLATALHYNASALGTFDKRLIEVAKETGLAIL